MSEGGDCPAVRNTQGYFSWENVAEVSDKFLG